MIQILMSLLRLLVWILRDACIAFMFVLLGGTVSTSGHQLCLATIRIASRSSVM